MVVCLSCAFLGTLHRGRSSASFKNERASAISAALAPDSCLVSTCNSPSLFRLFRTSFATCCMDRRQRPAACRLLRQLPFWRRLLQCRGRASILHAGGGADGKRRLEAGVDLGGGLDPAAARERERGAIVGHDRRQASWQGGQAVQRAVSTPLPYLTPTPFSTQPWRRAHAGGTTTCAPQ